MGGKDSISNLPDEVLGKILSLLPTKLVVSTCVLSKRWRNVFPLVDTFDYRPTTIPGGPSFVSFMYNHFLLNPPPPIKKFSLTCQYGNSDFWIRTVLERGCLELHVQCNLPLSIDISFFDTNTLVKLTLSDGVHLIDVRQNYDVRVDLDRAPYFPSLRSLSLGAVSVGADLFKLLIWHCPVLEELFIRDDDVDDLSTWQGFVSSESIKRLVVSVVNLPNDAVWLFTPALVFLDYSSCVPCYFGEVVLDSLVEARLDVRFWESPTDDDDGYGDFDGDVTNLVAGISNIKSLHLSPNSLEGLVHKVTNGCGDVCPCIPNNRKKRKMMMKVEVEEEEEEEDVDDTSCCLWSCQVKVLEISRYRGMWRELEQMRHFLGNLKYLETVNIYLHQEVKSSSYLRVTSDLKKLRRISPTCQIHFL
ncbi:unnamed protein product [Microthlaspi erraticum]|uniref:F-box domain-containing protein n=1 Tax=Microthlaspi erraticum TaxID=1685480 RepID=A0A6D2JIW1_9BRAS|nr:unnamed protein product [Microthlaspi erraticum]